MTRINDVTTDHLDQIPDLGVNAPRDIQALRARVFEGIDGWCYRLAPSIVARSEAELFSLSMPRFACRVYLDPKGLFFINARRIKTLCEFAKWGERTVPEGQGDQRFKRDPGAASRPWAVFSDCTCIGDCLLPVESTRYQGFHIVQADLGRIYGEIHGDAGEVRGMPYVMHMRLGGGWCAQAVCFMAAMLMHKHASGVHGVAEITALARLSPDAGNLRELPLTGLSLGEMAAYFEYIGLHPASQCLADSQGYLTNDPAMFEQAVWPYLRSDIPVVMLVDAGKMAGIPETAINCKSLYDENVVPLYMRPENAEDATRPRRHAILLVGYHSVQKQFLFNDSRAFPLMKGSAAQIIDARPYADNECQKSAHAAFIAVTPGPVRLPLQNAFGSGDGAQCSIGLLRMIEFLQRHGVPQSRLPTVWPDMWPGELCLSQLSCLKQCDIIEDGGVAKQITKICGELGFADDHWFWVQCLCRKSGRTKVADSVWVWNAQMNPVLQSADESMPEAALRFLVMVLKHDQSRWTEVFRSDPMPRTAAPKDPTIEEQAEAGDVPKVSLISSFAVRDGLRGAAGNWPPDVHACEAYGFMSADCAWLKEALGPSLNRDSPVMAVSCLADLGKNEKAVRDVAIRLGRTFGAVKLLGFATFVPEIISDPCLPAQDALKCLVRIAGHLKEEMGHPMHLIELVGGGLIRGVWPAIDQAAEDEYRPEAYVAECWADDRQALERLCKNLRPVAEEAEKHEVFLALELEPGPLFTLRNLETLDILCDVLDSDAMLRRRVGLNLDFAHWALAGIDPDSARKNTDILRRIVHCHAAGYAKGHLGDTVFGGLQSPLLMYKWIHLALAAARKPRPVGWPEFSGHISVEMEAAKDVSMVVESLNRLNQALGWVAGGQPPPKKWP